VNVFLNGFENRIRTLHHAAADYQQLRIIGVNERKGARRPNLDTSETDLGCDSISKVRATK
jgi:hypothetical protein